MAHPKGQRAKSYIAELSRIERALQATGFEDRFSMSGKDHDAL